MTDQEIPYLSLSSLLTKDESLIKTFIQELSTKGFCIVSLPSSLYSKSSECLKNSIEFFFLSG